MRATVHVFLKPGVLDVQGKAVEQALHGLGWADVSGVRVGRTIDQSTQSTIAVAEITTGSARLRPGLAVSATVKIEAPSLATASKNWSIPSTSVVRHRDQSWVFTRSADGFRARPVQVITESARNVAVRADFRASDEVASRGVLALLSELVDADKEE